jgi:hypothetical protein
LNRFIHVINANLGFPQATFVAMSFLLEIAQANPLVVEHLLKHCNQWCRWILFHHHKDGTGGDCHGNIRRCAEKLVMLLVPEVKSHFVIVERQKENSTVVEKVEEVDDMTLLPEQEISTASRESLNIVLDELKVLLRESGSKSDYCAHERYNKSEHEVLPEEGYRLTSLLRLLEWAMVGPAEKSALLQDRLVREAILAIYENFNRREIENDFNKLYMFKFLDRLSENHEAACHFIAAQENWVSLWISLCDTPNYYNYINKGLYHYYRVLYKACRIDEKFRDLFMFHTNFDWAFNLLSIKDAAKHYTRAAEFLVKIFDYFNECNPDFRNKWSLVRKK